jgi:hypothetical protein
LSYFTPIFSDWLTLFDGDSDSSEVLGHYCGDYDYVERDVISSGNVTFLSFQTDKIDTRKGFKLKYNPYSMKFHFTLMPNPSAIGLTL